MRLRRRFDWRKSWIPDQVRVVRNAFAGRKIPILRVLETRDVAVKENKLSARNVQIRVDKFVWTLNMAGFSFQRLLK
jgi:hypothetical protein